MPRLWRRAVLRATTVGMLGLELSGSRPYLLILLFLIYCHYLYTLGHFPSMYIFPFRCLNPSLLRIWVFLPFCFQHFVKSYLHCLSNESLLVESSLMHLRLFMLSRPGKEGSESLHQDVGSLFAQAWLSPWYLVV